MFKIETVVFPHQTVTFITSVRICCVCFFTPFFLVSQSLGLVPFPPFLPVFPLPPPSWVSHLQSFAKKALLTRQTASVAKTLTTVRISTGIQMHVSYTRGFRRKCSQKKKLADCDPLSSPTLFSTTSRHTFIPLLTGQHRTMSICQHTQDVIQVRAVCNVMRNHRVFADLQFLLTC